MTGSEQERRDFAVPAATGTYDDIDLAFLDRADENERRLLIEADRPTPTHETHSPHEPHEPRPNRAERRAAARRHRH